MYFDNYFSSALLVKHLALNKVLCCGTIRTNRKYLPTMKGNKELNNGDFDYYISNQDIVCKNGWIIELSMLFPISVELKAIKFLEPKKMGQRNDLAVRKLSMITVSTVVESVRLISIVLSME